MLNKGLYFLSGVVVGLFVDRYILSNEKEKKEETEERPMPENSEKEEIKKSEEISKENNYISEADEDEEDEEEDEELEKNVEYNESYEEFVKKCGGTIELIDYETSQSGYIDEFDVYDNYGSADDLYWFPNSDVLTDDHGVILSPVEKYLGEFSKELDENGDDDIFIRNNIMQKRYVVHNEKDAEPSDLFD